MQSLRDLIIESAIYEKNESGREKMIKLLKHKKYPDYLKTLNNMLKDEKFAALLDECFGGDLGNMKLRWKEQGTSVKKLLPTQSEICLDSSVKVPLAHPHLIKNFYAKGPITLFTPLVTFNGNYVIDGHHRWSQLFMFNPTAKMNCWDYSADISPIQMLKITQGAIAAYISNKDDDNDKEIPVSHGQGINIYKASEKEIKDYINEKMGPEAQAEILKYNPNLVSRDDIISFLTDNALEIAADHPSITNAPNRDLMPQTGVAGGTDKDSALSKMKDGKVLKVN